MRQQSIELAAHGHIKIPFRVNSYPLLQDKYILA